MEYKIIYKRYLHANVCLTLTICISVNCKRNELEFVSLNRVFILYYLLCYLQIWATYLINLMCWMDILMQTIEPTNNNKLLIHQNYFYSKKHYFLIFFKFNIIYRKQLSLYSLQKYFLFRNMFLNDNIKISINESN